jgi:hypothetical protein
MFLNKYPEVCSSDPAPCSPHPNAPPPQAPDIKLPQSARPSDPSDTFLPFLPFLPARPLPCMPAAAPCLYRPCCPAVWLWSSAGAACQPCCWTPMQTLCGHAAKALTHHPWPVCTLTSCMPAAARSRRPCRPAAWISSCAGSACKPCCYLMLPQACHITPACLPSCCPLLPQAMQPSRVALELCRGRLQAMLLDPYADSLWTHSLACLHAPHPACLLLPHATTCP